MFQFCHECINEYINAPSWITPIAQSITAIVAVFALIVAYRNLRGLKRTQSLQAQMNLINLENEVRRNHSVLKIADKKFIKAGYDKKDIDEFHLLQTEKLNAFEIYVCSADKLAALINSDYLKGHFKKRSWKNEYKDIFLKVKQIHQGEESIIPGKQFMINNIIKLLKKWDK